MKRRTLLMKVITNPAVVPVALTAPGLTTLKMKPKNKGTTTNPSPLTCADRSGTMKTIQEAQKPGSLDGAKKGLSSQACGKGPCRL